MTSLRRAARVAPAGTWPVERAADRVTLPFDDRHRRRLRLVTDAGTEFLLDLDRAVVLKDGDGLALDDGRWIEVRAAAEEVLEITAGTPGGLVRLAWHIGNRHVPAELSATRILIRNDPVIAGMLRGLGATVTAARAPFTPEGGAYAAPPATDGHGHDHSHGHSQGHDGHGHHSHEPDTSHGADHPHRHG